MATKKEYTAAIAAASVAVKAPDQMPPTMMTTSSRPQKLLRKATKRAFQPARARRG